MHASHVVACLACSVHEARDLYDQLAVVSPLMLALSGQLPARAVAWLPLTRGKFGLCSSGTDLSWLPC